MNDSFGWVEAFVTRCEQVFLVLDFELIHYMEVESAAHNIHEIKCLWAVTVLYKRVLNVISLNLCHGG